MRPFHSRGAHRKDGSPTLFSFVASLSLLVVACGDPRVHGPAPRDTTPAPSTETSSAARPDATQSVSSAHADATQSASSAAASTTASVSLAAEVRVDAIDTRRAAPGARIRIRGTGFSRVANDIRFDGVGPCGGYVWDVASPDGATLELTVPRTLAEFPKTRPYPGCGYVYLALALPVGPTSISVLNESGASNAVVFEVM